MRIIGLFWVYYLPEPHASDAGRHAPGFCGGVGLIQLASEGPTSPRPFRVAAELRAWWGLRPEPRLGLPAAAPPWQSRWQPRR
jgi:hypothetical protein